MLTGSGSKGVSQPGSGVWSILPGTPSPRLAAKLIHVHGFGKATDRYLASLVTGGPIVRLVCQLLEGSRSL